MIPIIYHSIGVVQSPVSKPLRPEEIRGQKARLCLKPEYQGAVSELKVGEHLQVIYHLHSLEGGQQYEQDQIFARRTASRPNPIGITLVRIVSLSGSTITVVGLDAIDGSPILDIKPYKPIFDEPPVTPSEHKRTRQRPVIVFTGGPGGGKSTLLEELAREPDFANTFVALPEAVQTARSTHISPSEKLFQRLMVRLQLAQEDALLQTLDISDPRPIICHRGSLDPLSFWLQRGWPAEAFFAFTQTTRAQHYQRYDVVIHLVTAADGAEEHYLRWPDAHRPETPQEAVKLDVGLQQAWGSHPSYHRLDNAESDWGEKSNRAKSILREFWSCRF